MDQACLNLHCAAALLDGLVAGGVARLVLSPGSRSTPLVLAGEAHPGLQLDTVLDERSAAFFALGLARAGARPVALLATSGSAPAHWYPAVIEAAQSGVPLVLLSADRPPELRGWGADQTIDQTRLFGTFAREFHDPGPPYPGAAPALRALGRRAAEVSRAKRGPVHLNLPFREPLVPQGECQAPALGPAADPGPAPLRTPDPAWRSRLAPLLRGRGLILGGPDDYPAGFAPALWALAERLQLPVLADPLSGLRWGGSPVQRVTRYDAVLRNPATAARLAPDWVLRFGRVPVSKTLNAWLAARPQVLVDPDGRWQDPEYAAQAQVRADPAAFCIWLTAQGLAIPDSGWAALWRAAEQRCSHLAAEHLDAAPWGEGQLLTGLLEQLPAGYSLFVANSLPIRQLDTWSGGRERAVRLYGNRGVSGIDGQLSTLAGLNADGVPTVGVIGDLSFWHDLGGLLLSDRWRAPLLVLNNGGGGIFGYLPQRALPGFERHWRTPVAHDIGAVLRGMGLGHCAVADAAEYGAALASAWSAEVPTVIEVRIDAAASQAAHQAYWRRVSTDSELSRL